MTERLTESAQLYAGCQSHDEILRRQAYTQLWRELCVVLRPLARAEPEGDAFVQDVAQSAIERVHQRMHECRNPSAFRAWARRIATNLALDRLRRSRRLNQITEQISAEMETHPSAESEALARVDLAEIRRLLERAPVSERSRRVVLGRYIDDLPDEQLARDEGNLVDVDVLPSHIQVTRSKNLAKLRTWQPLTDYLGLL